jgi:hypothetical protein
VATSRLPSTLAEVLDDAAGAGPVDGADLIDHLRDQLDAAARSATGVGGWTPDEPLRLTKRSAGWLLRCPRRAVAAEDATGPGDEVLVGYLVDAAAKVATLVPQRPATLGSARAYLEATGGPAVADRLAAGDGSFLADAQARVTALAAAWPRIDPAWWPRVEDPVRAHFAAGAVTVGGKLDVVLGGPPTRRPAVVVEVKAGRWYDGMRADGHLYALLLALRDGAAPWAAVTVVADGTTQVEPIRPALLAHAAERLEEAMAIAARLAAGEPPAAHPGPGCPHCPARPDCPPGQAWHPDPAAAVRA